jgi:hypothetical protein
MTFKQGTIQLCPMPVLVDPRFEIGGFAASMRIVDNKNGAKTILSRWTYLSRI